MVSAVLAGSDDNRRRAGSDSQRYFTEMIGVAFLEAQLNPFLALVVGSFMGMLFGFVWAGAVFVLLIGRMPNAVLWVLGQCNGVGPGHRASALFVLPLWLCQP